MIKEWYEHIKTGKRYILVQENLCVKQDGEWNKDFVLYRALYENPEGPYFVRKRDDFFENFIYMTVDSCPIAELCGDKIKESDYIMSIKEVKKRLMSGGFDDCVGYVCYCTDEYVTDVDVDYCDILTGKYRKEFTQVIIY